MARKPEELKEMEAKALAPALPMEERKYRRNIRDRRRRQSETDKVN